jgi:hypothetical protein
MLRWHNAELAHESHLIEHCPQMCHLAINYSDKNKRRGADSTVGRGNPHGIVTSLG